MRDKISPEKCVKTFQNSSFLKSLKLINCTIQIYNNYRALVYPYN